MPTGRGGFGRPFAISPLKRSETRERSVLRRFAAIGFTLAAVGCGGSGHAQPQQSGQETPAVTMSPASVELAPGGAQRFSASVTAPPDATLVWSVDEPAGGTVDGAGAYTAPAAG